MCDGFLNKTKTKIRVVAPTADITILKGSGRTFVNLQKKKNGKF
jgi:hypothetical protein